MVMIGLGYLMELNLQMHDQLHNLLQEYCMHSLGLGSEPSRLALCMSRIA